MAPSDGESPPQPDPTGQVQPLVGDLVASALRRIFVRGRSEISRAAHTGREHLELRQLQRDLDHFWARLGKTVYHLVRGGELDHPALRKAMARIDELEQRIDRHRAPPTDTP